MAKSILIAGALAQTACRGGLTWCFLQFLLGFRRLGYDVLFLDRLNEDMCVDADGRKTTLHDSINLKYFRRVMEQFGLAQSYSLFCSSNETIGQDRAEVLRRCRNAEFLLNVMAYFNDRDVLDCARRRVFLDIDPGFGQMWCDLGWHNPFEGHDTFVTLGRNIGQPDCSIPTCGLTWIPMAQPVVLEQWPQQPPVKGGAFTSIGAWRGPNAPIEYKGRTYGLRAHEFRKFMTLPVRCPETRFEQALEIHPADSKDIDALVANHWELVDPKKVAGSPEDYRAYIAGSRAEFMVPKQIYVDTNSGLLSDRSVYYLASGRPVLARQTGIDDLYPNGTGLLTFSTLDEAVAGVESINRDYDRHSKVAREIAVEFFDSDKVLSKLLTDLGVQ